MIWGVSRSVCTRPACSILQSLSLCTTRAEKLGQMMLVNQFVAGLYEEIKTKVVGIEGSFDQLLGKARFEEAKLRDLSTTGTGQSAGAHSISNRMDTVSPTQGSRVTTDNSNNGSNGRQQRLTTPRFNVGGQRANVRCYKCRSPSHLIRQCPYLTRARVTETSGAGMAAGQSTNKECVLNVTSTEISSNNHEQLTESEKEPGHCESSDVDIGEDLHK